MSYFKYFIAVLVFAPTAAFGFPDATNTGITTAKCPDYVPGNNTSSRTISVNDTVIINEDIAGPLLIAAGVSGVHISCVLIDNERNSTAAIRCAGTCPDLWVHDVELHNCQGSCISPNGTLAGPALIQRIYAHDSAQDYMKGKGSLVLEDSFFPDQFIFEEGSHNDAIQISGPADKQIYRRNSISTKFQLQTSALFFKSDFGDINRITIEDNFLFGGSHTFTLNCGTSPTTCNSFDQPTNIEVRRNTWGDNSWQFGPTNITLDQGPPLPVPCFIWELTNVLDDGPSTPLTAPADSTTSGNCWDESSMPGNPNPTHHGLRGGGISGGVGLSN